MAIVGSFRSRVAIAEISSVLLSLLPAPPFFSFLLSDFYFHGRQMPKPVSVRSGQVEFLKLNLEKREWRDTYQWFLALSWPEFAALIAGVYIVINLIFAEFYALGGESIAGMTPRSYYEAFFFSVQTLATVGYGHWYPQNLYGHVVTTVEIITGMFGLAVMTGLIFVRFSRPAARILFSKSAAIAPL